ncbi:MAG: hypothetical protein U9Q88_14355 [Bacillota bacterium]|nr:hypothetical protein [Bacillota bacterium]
MPIPFMAIAAVAALGGTAFGVGRYSRQGEINQLKQKIVELQKEVEVLQKLVTNQNETIRNLKAENKSLNALHFMEKRRLFGRTKGLIIFQYALREYLEFVRLESERKIQPNSTENTIYDILDRLFYGKEVFAEEKGLIKLYIEDKYPYQVKNLIPIPEEELYEALEGKRVG